VETASRFGLYTTSRPGGEPSSEDDADWMAVPYKVDDVVVNLKFRRLSEKEHAQTKGGKQVLWNRDVIRDQTLADYPLVITEGEWDAMAAIEAGYLRVVSVPGGAPSQAGTASHAYIDEAWNDIREVETIIIATDNDDNSWEFIIEITGDRELTVVSGKVVR
jgi:twinkle protein